MLVIKKLNKTQNRVKKNKEAGNWQNKTFPHLLQRVHTTFTEHNWKLEGCNASHSHRRDCIQKMLTSTWETRKQNVSRSSWSPKKKKQQNRAKTQFTCRGREMEHSIPYSNFVVFCWLQKIWPSLFHISEPFPTRYEHLHTHKSLHHDATSQALLSFSMINPPIKCQIGKSMNNCRISKHTAKCIKHVWIVTRFLSYKST